MAQRSPFLVRLSCRLVISPATVTGVPSGLASSPMSEAMGVSAWVARDVLDAEERVVGDVEAEHLPLERQQGGLVPLRGRHRWEAREWVEAHAAGAAVGSVVAEAEGGEEAVLADGLLLLDVDELSRRSARAPRREAASALTQRVEGPALDQSGAFDSLGESRRRLRSRCTSATSTQTSTSRSSRPSARTASSPPSRRRRRCRRRRWRRGPRPIRRLSRYWAPEWDKATLPVVRAGDARALRLRPSALRHGAHPRHARRHDDRLPARRRGQARRHPVTVAGLITSLQLKRTKKGDLWAIATVEDLDGAIECLFFPSAYMTILHDARAGHRVRIKGRISARDDSVSVFAQELTTPDIKEGPRGPVVLTPVARSGHRGASRATSRDPARAPRRGPKCASSSPSPADRCWWNRRLRCASAGSHSSLFR